MKINLVPLLSLVLLVGCSPGKPSSPASGASRAPTSLGATTNPLGTYELSGNALRVLQDKQISFIPGAGAAGTYTVTGLPAWASFNSSTGAITGVARTAADGGGQVTVTRSNAGTTTTYGPYSVVIVGDAMKEQQWHLINTGQTGYAQQNGTAGNDVNLKASVAANVLGTGVKIAISDSGTVVAHPDLAPNNIANQNRSYFNNFPVTNSWLGDPTPSYSSDDNAHGTGVAGLAAAKGWNGIGGRGVAPEASFAAFEFIPAQQQLANEGLADVGLQDQFNGVFDVFNYSWGDAQCVFNEYPDAYFNKIRYGVVNQRGGLGSVFVMAGGNDYVAELSDCYANVSSGYAFGNANFTEALTTPYEIAVGAVNADGVSSSYSSPGSAIWVSAPGGEYGFSSPVSGASQASEPALVTTDFLGCGAGLKNLVGGQSVFDSGGIPNTDCNYTNTMNGTSGASPIVTGTVALMLQVNPSLTWRDVKYILATTADRIDAARTQANQPGGAAFAGHTYELPWTQNAAGHWFHDWYGFGRVNVDNAVSAARLYSANSLGTFTETNWANDSNTISVTAPTGGTRASGATSPLTVSSTLSIEAVQVRASVTGCAGSVGLELTSPAGTVSYLMNVNSGLRDANIVNHRFLSNAFLDEHANGTWTLRVVAGSTSCAPVLTNWKLNFVGH